MANQPRLVPVGGKGAVNHCDNCNWTGPDEELNVEFPDIPDLMERIEPGGVVPSGECPACECLCYPVEDKPCPTTTAPQPRS